MAMAKAMPINMATAMGRMEAMDIIVMTKVSWKTNHCKRVGLMIGAINSKLPKEYL
jgi:hypothetical protein